jgi:hypothetical protein
MATGRPFTARASIPLIIAATDSVGSHLAAKLSEFASDERTLTDELCDMLCIWSQQFARVGSALPFSRSVPPVMFDFSLRKTTASEEAAIGADLELTLTTPLGSKTSLIQAKVFESSKNSLRYDAAKDWHRLRRQLVSARARVGDLAFLLLYLPSSMLDRDSQLFGTWEQGFQSPSPGSGTSSKFGTTFIPVSELLNSRNFWKSKARLGYLGAAQFSPAGISFSRLVLEMLACRRGSWQKSPAVTPVNSDDARERVESYRRLDISVGEPDEISFERLANSLSNLLDEFGS